MYAVVTTVRIAAGQFETASKGLHSDVVPQVRKAPGFAKGVWAVNADKTQGHSVVLFGSKEQADAAAQMARSGPMPAGVTIAYLEIYEVVAEA
jgi:hypothetical protein